MPKPEGKKKTTKAKGLGFFYPSESQPYIDAEEYKALLESGKLSEDETSFLRQFLKEYYGRRTKSDLKLHSDNHNLLAAQRSRRRDITLSKASSKSFSRYTSADYFAARANPEKFLLLKEELEFEFQKRKRSFLK